MTSSLCSVIHKEVRGKQKTRPQRRVLNFSCSASNCSGVAPSGMGSFDIFSISRRDSLTIHHVPMVTTPSATIPKVVYIFITYLRSSASFKLALTKATKTKVREMTLTFLSLRLAYIGRIFIFPFNQGFICSISVCSGPKSTSFAAVLIILRTGRKSSVGPAICTTNL